VNSPHPPPAGWYPDPSGRAPFRYWDGSQWTEHTDQGTPPSPSVGQPAAPAPQASAGTPAPPQGYGQQFVPGSAAGSAASTAAAGSLTVQSFLDDLKRFEGYAVVVAGALLFIIFSFLPWVSTELSGFDVNTGAPVTQSDSANAWDGDTAWWIRGWDVNVQNLQTATLDSGTDMILLLPLALAGAGLVIALRLGRAVSYGREIVLGASAVLAALMIGEVMHMSSVLDEVPALMLQINGPSFSGSISFGMYLATLAALVMAVGAGRSLMAAKQAKV